MQIADIFAGETLRDRPELAWLGEEYRVEVTNADQLILFHPYCDGCRRPCDKGEAISLSRNVESRPRQLVEPRVIELCQFFVGCDRVWMGRPLGHCPLGKGSFQNYLASSENMTHPP